MKKSTGFWLGISAGLAAGAAAGTMLLSKESMKTQVGQGIHKLGVAVDHAVDSAASELR